MAMSTFNTMSLLVGVALIGRGHLPAPAKVLARFSQGSQVELAATSRSQLEDSSGFAARLAGGALAEVGKITDFDETPRKIPFPNGDVPPDRGNSADLIVRSYRHAGIDLQSLLFQDKSRRPYGYPMRGNSTAPDPNFDQRHVPTLTAFLASRGARLPVTRNAADYRPGDIIACNGPGGRPHIAIVVPSPVRGQPWIVHNIHWGPRIEDKLFEYPMTGHFRYLPGF